MLSVGIMSFLSNGRMSLYLYLSKGISPSINDWHHIIGCEGIYLERGRILRVRLISVTPLEMDGHIGADFSLQILEVFSRSSVSENADSSLGSVDDLEVGSVFLEDRNEIITASGYVAWKLILNADLVEKITVAIKINVSEISAYRLAKSICENTKWINI
jgi:hypothetical protein